MLWLTKSILLSIRRKQWLYKTLFQHSNSLEEELFKTHVNNIMTKVKSLSKKIYFQTEIDNTKSNHKK